MRKTGDARTSETGLARKETPSTPSSRTTGSSATSSPFHDWQSCPLCGRSTSAFVGRHALGCSIAQHRIVSGLCGSSCRTILGRMISGMLCSFCQGNSITAVSLLEPATGLTFMQLRKLHRSLRGSQVPRTSLTLADPNPIEPSRLRFEQLKRLMLLRSLRTEGSTLTWLIHLSRRGRTLSDAFSR